MSRSLSYLRRGLLGIAFVGSLGFGVTQALASPVRTTALAECDAARCAARCNYPGMYGICTQGHCYCVGY